MEPSPSDDFHSGVRGRSESAAGSSQCCSPDQPSIPPLHQAPAHSQGALQCVVVVLETLQLQEVFGTFALLAGRKVGDLDGGGVGDFRGQREVFDC